MQAPLQLSYYDVYLHPFVRDSDIIIPGFLGWFFVQFITNIVFNLVSSKYRSLPKEDKQQFGVRMCAILNGIAMSNSAYYFVREMQINNWSFHHDHYQEIDGYRPYRLLIVSYFLWDIVVCIAYGWSWKWTLHGVVSFFGTYFLAYPYAEQYATYYSGMFELSNAFYHVACIIRQLDGPAGVATLLEYSFGVMFLVIRIIGGTYVTSMYWLDMIELIRSGKAHAVSPIVCCLLLVLVVMFLQYVWFGDIIKAATGKGTPNDTPTSPTQAKKQPNEGGLEKSHQSGSSNKSVRRAAPKQD